MATNDAVADAKAASAGGETAAGKKPNGWVGHLKIVAFAFLPDFLQKIIEGGALKTLLIVFGVLVVLPLALLLLAGIWLTLLGSVEVAGIAAIRKAFLDVVQTGLSMEEVASRSHGRLDYLHLFDIELKPKNVNSKEVRLTLERGQKAAIDLRLVEFQADRQDCSVSEDDVDLVDVLLGDRMVTTMRKANEPDPIWIDEEWWRREGAKFEKGRSVQRLTFRLTKDVKKAACGRVHVEGSVRVFKDLVPGSAKN